MLLLTLSKSILSIVAFKDIPRAVWVSGLSLSVLNNAPCKNSWAATLTAFSLEAISLFITIVCSPVLGSWYIKPWLPEAFLSISSPFSLIKTSMSSALAKSLTSSPSMFLAWSFTVFIFSSNLLFDDSSNKTLLISVMFFRSCSAIFFTDCTWLGLLIIDFYLSIFWLLEA